MAKTNNLPPYTLKKSNRKTLSIYIERDGSVSVLAPESLEDDRIKEWVERKSYSIHKHLAEWRSLNETRVVRELVNGESYLYLGRNYTLQFVEEQDKPLKFLNGYFFMKKEVAADAQNVFKDFYREKGRKRIAERVRFYKDRMGVEPKEVKVMELKNRWASCTSSGNLNFHWRCMMAPLKILDYIVVHEMAHLIHPTHTEAFWAEVDKVLPDYRERKQWLRVHGAGMDL